MQSNAQILPVGTSLLAVWVGKLSSLVSAKYTSAWSAPTSFQSTGSIPSLTAMGTQAKVVYLGLDGAYYVGTYNAGWDTADTSAEPSGGITIPEERAVARRGREHARLCLHRFGRLAEPGLELRLDVRRAEEPRHGVLPTRRSRR